MASEDDCIGQSTVFQSVFKAAGRCSWDIVVVQVGWYWNLERGNNVDTSSSKLGVPAHHSHAPLKDDIVVIVLTGGLLRVSLLNFLALSVASKLDR